MKVINFRWHFDHHLRLWGLLSYFFR